MQILNLCTGDCTVPELCTAEKNVYKWEYRELANYIFLQLAGIKVINVGWHGIFFRLFCKVAKSDCQLCHNCLSIHMEQLNSYWTEVNEISYLCFFWKYVAKVQVSLISDKNNIYFTWRHMHFYDCILLNSSYNEKCLKKTVKKIKT
jgi:hypothetical protein